MRSWNEIVARGQAALDATTNVPDYVARDTDEVRDHVTSIVAMGNLCGLNFAAARRYVNRLEWIWAEAYQLQQGVRR